MTVNELYASLSIEKKLGNGERIVLVSDDDECNGYHCLWGFEPELGEPMSYVDANGRHCSGQTICFS